MVLAQGRKIDNRKIAWSAALHRPLNHQRLTLAAIDEVILRDRWQDRADLRRAVLTDRVLPEKVERVCRPYASDPYAQRHHFGLHYNYFKHPLTGACTESLNSLSRMMHRLGRGYSFAALRANVLFTEGIHSHTPKRPRFERRREPGPVEMGYGLADEETGHGLR